MTGRRGCSLPRIHPDIIDSVRFFRKRAPYKGSFDEKMSKYKAFLSVLSHYYGVSTPKLYVTDPSKRKTPFDFVLDLVKGMYYHGKISIRKFSVISLLHEFRHYLQERCQNIIRVSQDNEEDANAWSHHVFKQSWGERYVFLFETGQLNRTRTVV